MIRITQLKLPVDHTEEDLRQQIARKLRCHAGSFSWKIVRQSLDARHKDDKKYVYTVDVSVENEKKILRKVHDNNIMLITKKEYHFPSAGGKAPKHPPVIVGSGPAGLFCAWYLARVGMRPVVLERGEEADKRKETVDAFWKTAFWIPIPTYSSVRAGRGLFPTGSLTLW